MKKILLLALVAMGFAGCSAEIDWASFSYYTWVNNSDHTITLSLESMDYDDPKVENIALSPGERYEVMRDYLIPPGDSWKMTVLFDDGVYGWTFGYEQPKPENYRSRYDPTLEYNYIYEDVNSPEGCSKCSGRRWTYTFTNDDYDAATQYGPRPEE